jgi:hypothetical protein
MPHLKDIELIELAADRADPAAVECLRNHVRACPECAARLREVARIDAALELWTVPDRRVELRGRVSEALDPEPTGGGPAWWIAPARAAALIAVSAAMGHLAAQASWRAASSPPITPAAVAGDLYLESLAIGTPAGLGDFALDSLTEDAP